MMPWNVNIVLKSGKNIVVDKLVSINTKMTSDDSIKKMEDFKSFHLSQNQRLSFVGEKGVATLISNEIEYVEIYEY